MSTKRASCLRRSLFSGYGAFSFDCLDLSPQPLSERVFHLDLASGAVQIFHRLTILGELDEAARNAIGAALGRDKLLQ